MKRPRIHREGRGLITGTVLLLFLINIPVYMLTTEMEMQWIFGVTLALAAMLLVFVTYFFLTVAELFISPLGLSFVSKVAPRHMVGLCQGLWLGATAIGNLFIWVGPVMYNAWPIQYCWAVFFAICLISMGVMLGMVKWLEKVTK